MSAATQMPAETMPAAPEIDVTDALLSLSAAAGTITRQHYRIPTERERLNLGDAVVRILRLGRAHGLSEAPKMRAEEASETFRLALRLALDAGVPRMRLVAIFNGDDGEPEDAGRKDFQ